MARNSFLKSLTVKVPKRSAFDKSYRNLLTLPIGTLVPLMCDEVIPNTKVDLNIALNGCLPPLASETFMNVDLKLAAAFIPFRLLYGGYTAWLTGEKLFNRSSSTYVNVEIPALKISSSQMSYVGPGSLADYLGFKMSASDLSSVGALSPAVSQNFSIFPFLAYHRFYDDWFRNTVVQNPIFTQPLRSTTTNILSELPYSFYGSFNNSYSPTSTFADGVKISDLRQANFGLDFFSAATPNAQLGSPQSITIDTSGSSTQLSISSIRTANSLQMWLERNSYSVRYQDYLHSNFGADLSDGVAQRCLYLGSGSVPIYTKGIYQQAPSASGGGSVITNNPFNTSVGAEYGSASANGVVHLINNFTAQEPGYIFVMMWVSPEVTYANGIDHMFLRYNRSGSQVDMANALLQNVGAEPIMAGELRGKDAFDNPAGVFGYTDRFAHFMVKNHELHGLVRDGYSLQSFALQRTFSSTPGINSQFLEIPSTYLDQVAAAPAGVSNYGAWVDSYLQYRVSMPLAQYSIPSLQDPAYEHGVDVKIRRGGSQIS